MHEHAQFVIDALLYWEPVQIFQDSRDQMASVRTRDELLIGELAEEARVSQLGDPRRRRYSSPIAIALERIRAGQIENLV